MTGNTTTRKASPRRKGEAARAERNGKPSTIDFRGITITLPKVLPGTLYFDFVDVAANDSDMGAQIRLLTSLIGEEHVQRVREKVAQDKIPLSKMPQVMSDLFDAVFEAFGMTTGESSASPES